MFRLINKDTGTILLNERVQQSEPYLRNEPIDHMSNPRDEQYFKFIFESMEFLRIEYDLEEGKIYDAQSHILETQTLVNRTGLEQEFRFELDTKKVHTGNWEYSGGFPVSAVKSYETGIPMVLEGRVSKIDVSQIDRAWEFGRARMLSFNKQWKASIPVRVVPDETVRVTSTIIRGQLEVPFKIVLRSKTGGIEVFSHGTWRGTSTWDLRHTITSV